MIDDKLATDAAVGEAFNVAAIRVFVGVLLGVFVGVFVGGFVGDGVIVAIGSAALRTDSVGCLCVGVTVAAAGRSLAADV